MITVSDKTKFISHSLGLLIVIMALADILHTRILLIIAAMFSVIIFLYSFPLSKRSLVSESSVFILFLLIASFMNLYFTQNNFGGSLTLTGNLLISFLYLQSNKKTLTLWVVLAYSITIIFISYHLFVLNTDANFIYEGLSRNHAGFAAVFYTVFLLFHLKIAYNVFPLIFPFIGIILAFFLFGRTSLIVSALLFVVVFFYKFKKNQTIRLLATALFIALCGYLWLRFGYILTEETNLGEGLETSRYKLWSIYFENINILNLFTGIDVATLPGYDIYGGNPHNSFLKFHSRVGIGSIVFIVLFFISIFNYLKKRQFYIFWLLMLLALRAFFDSDIFIGNFDFIFLIITFYWIKTD